MSPRKIFIGGYTKSGTTFIGRAFGLFNNVYAKGELDYFRIFYKGFEELVVDYNKNISIVNREVYDGKGSLEPVTVKSFRRLHDKMFTHLYFAGKPVPDDCQVMVEKSPRNIFMLNQISYLFPDAVNVCVYREPQAVFRSLMRHMADHRDSNFFDPDYKKRSSMLHGFFVRWNKYADIIEEKRTMIKLVNYEAAAADNQAFLDFAEKEILGFSPGLRAPVETLSKEYYLKSLPQEARDKSLVQTGPHKIILSRNEVDLINENSRIPSMSFDF